jgi:hypothetical protein
MTEKKYRIRKTIDVTVSPDEDGDIRVPDVTGLQGGYYTTDTELRSVGFRVEEIEPTPADDPAGTVREFVPSGDRIVKIGDRWMYVHIKQDSWGNTVGEFLSERFPAGFSKTTVVSRPSGS